MQVARIHAWDRVRVQQPCSNPGEQGQTRTIAFWREYAYLQEFPNTRDDYGVLSPLLHSGGQGFESPRLHL
jgi:hypothetical protein